MKKLKLTLSLILSISIIICGLCPVAFATEESPVSIGFYTDRTVIREGDFITLTATAYPNGDDSYLSKLMQTELVYDSSVFDVKIISKLNNSNIVTGTPENPSVRFAMIDTSLNNSGVEIKKDGTELFKLKFTAKEGSTGFGGSLFTTNSAWIGDENWVPAETHCGDAPHASIADMFKADSAKANITRTPVFKFGCKIDAIINYIENYTTATVYSEDKTQSEGGYKISGVVCDEFADKTAGDYTFKGVVAAKEFDGSKIAYSDHDIEVLIPVTVEKFDLATGEYSIKLNTPYVEFKEQDSGTMSPQNIVDAINQMKITPSVEITDSQSLAVGYSENVTLSATEADGSLDLTEVSDTDQGTNVVSVSTDTIFMNNTNFKNTNLTLPLYAVVVKNSIEGSVSVSDTLINSAPSVSIETDSLNIIEGKVAKARIYNPDGTYIESAYTITQEDVTEAEKQSKYTLTLPPFEKTFREMGYTLGDTVYIYSYLDGSPIEEGGERAKSIVTTTIKGDVNGDGNVDDMDWTIIFNHVSYIIEHKGLPSWDDGKYTQSIFDAADVNNDNAVDDMDWTIVFNHVSYIIEDSNLPPWE